MSWPTAAPVPALAWTLALGASALAACSAPSKPAGPAKPDPGELHAEAPRAALVGHRAPAAALELLGGERVVLDELVGKKPVYLKFWATWCVPCNEQMPHLEATHRKYGDRIAVFAVDLGLNDAIETVRAFQAERALTVPIAIDGDGSLAERYRVSVTPQHILIDRAGIVRYVGHGATAELDAALQALLGDAAPAVAAPAPAPAATEAAGDAPLSLALRDGSQFALAGHAGRPVALTFVSESFDEYLAKSRPAMAEACAAHIRQVAAIQPANPQVDWVIIVHPVWAATDSVDDYRKRFAITAPIGIDDRSVWFHRYRVRDVPMTILLDRSGAEVARIAGRGDDLARALTALR